MNCRRLVGPLIGLALVSGFAACGQTVDPGGPVGPGSPGEQGPVVPGTLEVTVVVNGTQPDADGYAVVLTLSSQDGRGERVESTGGTVRFEDLEPGSHSVRMEDLAANCFIDGGRTRSFTIASDRTSRITFGVRCPGPGALLVKTVSQGVELDPDGYALAVEGSSIREERIGANDSLFLKAEDLLSDVDWIVRLTEVPDRCMVLSEVMPLQAMVSSAPLKIRLRGDTTVRVTFTTTCLQRSSTIAFESDVDIHVLTSEGGMARANLTNHPAQDLSPALSPDRSRIVFSSDRDNPAGEFDLYSMNVDGSGLVRLTNSPGNNWVGSQAWSPDGSRIVFWSGRDESSGEIYIMNADGSGVVRLTDNSHSDGCAAWSPDGSSIAFCSGDIISGIYRMGTTPGSPIVRIASEGSSPNWSPNGSKIAYMTGGCWDTGCDIAVVGATGTGFVQLHPDGANYNAVQPSWSPDGTWIAFVRVGFPNSDLAIVRFEGNGFGEIVHLTDGYAPSWR